MVDNKVTVINEKYNDDCAGYWALDVVERWI